MKEVLMVGIGGFLGTIARYGTFILYQKYFEDKTYFATLIVNLVGCLLIGLLSGVLVRLNQYQSLLLVTGICGGFTTFSTFALDGLKLLKSGHYEQFLMYSSISLIGGLLLCLLGFHLTNK